MVVERVTERIARALCDLLITLLNILLLLVVGLSVMVLMMRTRQRSEPVERNPGWLHRTNEGIIQRGQLA